MSQSPWRWPHQECRAFWKHTVTWSLISDIISQTVLIMIFITFSVRSKILGSRCQVNVVLNQTSLWSFHLIATLNNSQQLIHVFRFYRTSPAVTLCRLWRHFHHNFPTFRLNWESQMFLLIKHQCISQVDCKSTAYCTAFMITWIRAECWKRFSISKLWAKCFSNKDFIQSDESYSDTNTPS